MPQLTPEPMSLIPFDEVSRRLALSRRSYLGLQAIAIDRIVGSVDRSADFRRDFRPQRRISRGRLTNLREAFPDGVMPAINVFEVGGGVRRRGRPPSRRPRARTRRRLHRCRGDAPGNAVRDRRGHRRRSAIHTEQQRKLLEASGLSRARPDAVIEFTFVDGYTQLAEIIQAHGCELARRAGELPIPEQVAADWCETVYRPGLDAVRRAGLPELYACWNPTETDLFLWVYKTRRDLRGQDAAN